jgi:hypothetical protein
MSMRVNYMRVAADHIELLQKDLMDVWCDLHPDADYPDEYPTVTDILKEFPGDVEILTIHGWDALSWLLSPLKREETRRRALGQLLGQDSWPAIDLPLAAIEGRDSQLSVPAVDYGLGQGAAFDSTTVQKLSTVLSQITTDDLFRNFDFDTMQRFNLGGFGRTFIPDEEGKLAEKKLTAEERSAEERLARECVGRDFQALHQFYRRAEASSQYIIIVFS